MTDEIFYNKYDDPSINERFIQIYNNLTNINNKKLFFEDYQSERIYKNQSDEMSNEFTNGYFINYSELCILLFILIFWLMAVRKFINNFNKIRTTHYREMPYKYKIKDSTNNSQRDNQNFQPNPINRIIKESKLAHQYDLISNPNTTNNSLYSIKQSYINSNRDNSIENSIIAPPCHTNKKRLQFSIKKNNDTDTKYKNLAESRVTNVNEIKADEGLNLSLGNFKFRRSCLRRDDSILNDNIYRSTMHKVNTPRCYDQHRSLKVKGMLRNGSNQRHKKIDHPMKISPIIRRSFLELHKAVEIKNNNDQETDTAV